ncbi:MAG: hypothetical protein MJ065_06670 [Oscillospiraceae bacterium]|nr:hypothetical protein [Oscillospiraceae bacterium]
MELYRPLISEEYRAVEAMGFEGFPPRSEEQPLFTALLSEEGATQIARHMRISKATENFIYVVSFIVDDAYIRQFPVQHAKERERQALWIPADEVEILNQHLIGRIRLLASYQIDRSDGEVFFA